ncbi:MAG: tetratricopeptide repeat protein [Rikenella sp.]|nr:tetratricopeptide repeat protein [Rikenella sp.]
MELSEQIDKQIEKLSEQGNRAMDKENYEKAIDLFQQALALLPEPKEEWEAYSWLRVSIGDAYFMLEDYVKSEENFRMGYVAGELLDNPFVLLRLGQNYVELEQEERAVEYLLKAYMLEGEDIFEEEEEYLEWLAERVDLEERNEADDE